MGDHSSTAAREEINPKGTARQQALISRQRLSPAWIQETSLAIQRRVLSLPEYKSARAAACYLALPMEAQTDAIVQDCWKGDKQLAVPAFDKRRSRYGLAWYRARDATQEGAFGIAEPRNIEWVEPRHFDLLIVPCVAFDRFGRRLGHGGGHFDQLLGRHDGLRVCLAFEGQCLAAVPTEPHDIAVDLIVTEKNIYDARRNEY